MTCEVTSCVDAFRSGVLGNSAVKPASAALKTTGLLALLLATLEPPQAASRPTSSTRLPASQARLTAPLACGARLPASPLLLILPFGRKGADRGHDLGVRQRRHIAE